MNYVRVSVVNSLQCFNLPERLDLFGTEKCTVTIGLKYIFKALIIVFIP